jgi:hypothetical protein
MIGLGADAIQEDMHSKSKTKGFGFVRDLRVTIRMYLSHHPALDHSGYRHQVHLLVVVEEEEQHLPVRLKNAQWIQV